MAIPFNKYIFLKDKCCICYFGNNKNQIKNLIQIRQIIEKEMPELEIYIICSDKHRRSVNGKKLIVFESDMEKMRGVVGFSCELQDDEKVDEFLERCGIYKGDSITLTSNKE